ncbi:MAG: alr [Burkholderiales bacterium]|jgi:alanine racemase|nr:alr [Burkholderiales bacterium]
MHNASIIIDKSQFIRNLQAISSWVNRNPPVASNRLNKVKFCLPVKANAYGHGLVKIAQIAEEYVDYLAVACLDEGITLRQNGIKKPILVFGAFSQEQIYDLIIHNLEITISSLLKARMVMDVCQKLKLSCKVHIKIDTGMNRVGVRSENVHVLIDFILNSDCMKLVGVYSHLASSDIPGNEFTYKQIKEFNEIVAFVKETNPEVICHLANSGGVCYYPESYLDMVRPGIFSYGYLPGNNAVDDVLKTVQPCFSLKSQIIYFKVVAKGSAISYNQQYVTNRQTRIVTVPLGYGDGYRRALSNCGEVLIHGHKYTVSGTICMDIFMVDIGPDGEAYIGDEVVLIGRQGAYEITLTSVANKCQTITYEILCGFNERLPRIYV